MKILCRHEQMASHYIYSGLGSSLVKSGHTFAFWDQKTKPAFDVFSEYQPDIFFGQGYNLDGATIKCLNQNPHIKIFLKVGCWGELNKEEDLSEYHILMADDKEKRSIDSLKNNNDITLLNYCHKNRVPYVIGGWKDHGTLWGLLPAADVKNFYPEEKDERYSSDIVFVGGYWGYKGKNLDRFIIPLCYPVGKHNIKIFGNQHWSPPQYCGFINDEDLRKVLSNSTICPNIHEPHSNRYGFDVLNRIFNIVACGGFCISDYVSSIEEDIFVKDEMVLAKTSDEFFEKINHFLKNPDDRLPYIERAKKITLTSHTYENRINEMMEFV